MKIKVYLFVACGFLFVSGFGQSNKTASSKTSALPLEFYMTMRDSATSMDIVMMQGAGGSLSVDGRNVQLFSSFFESETGDKTNAPLAGTIMWLLNGRELISGNYFLGDSTGYVVFQKDGKEFVNRINTQGNSFLKAQIKK